MLSVSLFPSGARSKWPRQGPLLLLVLLGCPGILSGCDSEGPDPNETPPTEEQSPALATLEVSAATASIAALGEVIALTAVGKDASGNTLPLREVTWITSDANVVEIFPNAEDASRASARSVANGTATLSARSADIEGAFEITVHQRIRQLVIGSDDLIVELPGDTQQIETFPSDSRGNPITTATISWSSTDPNVATVDDTGNVTAVSFGSTTIQATADEFTDEVAFSVIGDRFFLNGDVRLRYDLDLPPVGTGPFPVIIWVHGSGQLDRNTQRGATDPLVPEGMAVLRYDKRGVGASTGAFFNISAFNSGTTLSLLASDAAAAARFLTRFPEIDPSRIGIAGNSQGGWIAPLAASQTERVSYLMLWSGPTVSVGMEIFYSNLAEGTSTPLDDVYAQLGGFNGVVGYDPAPVLETLTIPSIWLFGEIDRSIPVRLDTLNMRRFQERGLPYEYILYPSARHDLRDTRTGQFVDVWSDWLAWLRRQNIL